MDHAIEWLCDYSGFNRNIFIEEWQSGEYKKISDCPSYYEVKAYCDAINTLSKYYGTARFETPREIIKDIEIR